VRQPHPLRCDRHPADALLSSLQPRRRADRRAERDAVGDHRRGVVPLVWQRRCGGGAAGGTSAERGVIPAAGLQLLRPALEFAWTVARTGESQLVPGIMRPLMHFAKRPDRALDTTARALEEDEDFRARVALGADELIVG